MQKFLTRLHGTFPSIRVHHLEHIISNLKSKTFTQLNDQTAIVQIPHPDFVISENDPNELTIVPSSENMTFERKQGIIPKLQRAFCELLSRDPSSCKGYEARILSPVPKRRHLYCDFHGYQDQFGFTCLVCLYYPQNDTLYVYTCKTEQTPECQ